MKINRRFTSPDQSPYTGIDFRSADSEIRNPDGTTVFELKGFEVPADWSQVAADILAQKYFRKSGVPQCLKTVEFYIKLGFHLINRLLTIKKTFEDIR